MSPSTWRRSLYALIDSHELLIRIYEAQQREEPTAAGVVQIAIHRERLVYERAALAAMDAR